MNNQDQSPSPWRSVPVQSDREDSPHSNGTGNPGPGPWPAPPPPASQPTSPLPGRQSPPQQPPPGWQSPPGQQPSPAWQPPGQQWDEPGPVPDPLDLFVPDRGRHHSIAAAGLPQYAVQRSRGTLCPLLIVWGARGGVGKSTLALQIAQRAGELSPGLRVTLVDGNRSQGDVRVYLRISDSASVRSMYDAVTASNPASAVVLADELNSHRGSLTPAKFAAALAPLGDQAPAVSASTYGHVIQAAREQSDLVVMDTPPLGEGDTAPRFDELVDGLVVPLLATNSWGLAVTDESTPGAVHTRNVLRHMAKRQVPRDRMFMVVNKAVTSDSTGDAAIRRAYGEHVGHYLGRIGYDAGIVQSMNAGQMVHAHPELAEPIDRMLLMILGRAEFDTAARQPGKDRNRGRGKWWRRTFGGQ